MCVINFDYFLFTYCAPVIAFQRAIHRNTRFFWEKPFIVNRIKFNLRYCQQSAFINNRVVPDIFVQTNGYQFLLNMATLILEHCNIRLDKFSKTTERSQQRLVWRNWHVLQVIVKIHYLAQSHFIAYTIIYVNHIRLSLNTRSNLFSSIAHT